MAFIDKVKVTVAAGKGGDGKLSMRHEKFVDKGGPDGGDGGDGGDVVLVASRNQNTLAAFRYQKQIKAEDGHGGGKQRMHGKSAKHLMVQVPVGTIATTGDGVIIADLAEDGQKEVIAKGGRGGFGNAHFVSSRRQTPRFAEKGEPGDDLDNLTLELKMIADVGLVGMPNAGKSTLLSKLSNARPEIADYAFTTLRPNLGVVDINGEVSVLFADIPGLIEGAADGKGLGHAFLRHVERTAVILHLIDAYSDNVAVAYKTVKAELKAYQADLVDRPEVIALTKVEGLDEEITNDLIKQLKKVAPKDAVIFAISAQAGIGTREMLFAIKERVEKARAVYAEELEADKLPVLRMTNTSDAYDVILEDDRFIVHGERIEKFAKRTDFDNEEGVQRLRDIMRRAGILHNMVRKGIEADQMIQIGNDRKRSFRY
ncbi:MAG: GTPase ObgE [Patescibacteria group bacterium]|nr:GTPase ObgE [Patescibacteria group bacterium]